MRFEQLQYYERIMLLRGQIMERGGSFVAGMNPYVMDAALWCSRGEERSRVQRRAALLKAQVELAPLEIPPLWRMAGEHLPAASGSWGTLRKDWDGGASAPGNLGVAPDEWRLVKAEVERWTGIRPPRESYAIGEMEDAASAGRGSWSNKPGQVFWASGWVENHSVRDFAKVLRIGFAGIKEEVESVLAGMAITDPDYPRKENFLKAACMVCEAGITLSRRYAEFAASMAEAEVCPERADELRGMAAMCSQVPARGARSFREAVQSLWLAHILTCGEDGINANSIGRLDQILFTYYQSDIDKGLLTREEVLEIMAELGCKLYLEYDVQAIVLGGLDADGGQAANELTGIILEATDQLDFIRDLSVRLDAKSPDWLVERCAKLIIKGGGIPFIFNDDCFVKALTERGIAPEHARDYAPIGCIELTIPGKANPHAVSGWINATKCLELALFGGNDPQTGQQLGPETPVLTAMGSYEEFWEAYKRQLEHFSAKMVYFCNRGELLQREFGPLPCWSVLTDDCIKRGRDITDSGAIYNYHSVCFLGTANTADSLCAVRKLVFEQGKISAAELLDALRGNFEGCEGLRQLLLKGVPKYGNDISEVDAIAREVDEHFIKFMDRQRSPLDGRYFVHLFSFLCNIAFGKTTGATADGRLAGEPIAYSLSAQQGRDEKGVTAMLNSLAKLPHDMAAGASAAIVEISPKMFDGEDGVQRMVNIIKTLLAMRVGQIQFNVVTVEKLELARREPDKHGNIPVRVAGFSQMFKLINRELQDHIIARTKHES